MAMAAHTASLLPSRRVALQREPSLSASARGVREARARPTFLVSSALGDVQGLSARMHAGTVGCSLELRQKPRVYAPSPGAAARGSPSMFASPSAPSPSWLYKLALSARQAKCLQQCTAGASGSCKSNGSTAGTDLLSRAIGVWRGGRISSGLGSRQPWRSVEGLGCGVCGEQAPLRAAVLKAGTSLTNGRRCSRVRATAIEGQQAEPGGSSPAGGDDGPEGSSTGGSPGGPGSQRMGAQQAPQSSNGTALPLNPFTPGKLSSRVAAKGGAAGGEQELKGLSPPSNSPSAPSAASVVGESLSPPPSSAETKSRSPFAPPTTLPSPQSPQSPFGSPPGKAFQAPKREDPLSALKGTSPKPAVGSIRPNPSFAGGKKLLEAFKEDKFENKVKPGQPRAPANIFDDPRRTAEEIEAEKWRFSLDSGQILLILSFFASSMLMFATVWVVWKLGAIHFDEY